MSNYNNDAIRSKKQLDMISDTMCYAKWAQSSINLINGKTHSCYHPPLHDIDLDEIELNPAALHNTKIKKYERQQMLAGSRPDGCNYCWKIEDSGAISDRVYRSGEYWAQNARKEIFDALDDRNVNPRYLEVNFNQACNFSCMYCSPHLSTKWEEHIINHGPYLLRGTSDVEIKHNDLSGLKDLMPLKVKQEDNPYLQAFWKWWPSLYKSLEVFRITGGEPLMDNNTFRVLDYIYENPNTWLEMSITTNLCPPNQQLFEKFISKVKKLEEIQIWEDKERYNPGSGNHWYVNPSLKNFALFVSLDNVGARAEYIRPGLSFNTMENNVNSFLNSTNNTTVTFINTFNSLSVIGFIDFLEFILSLRHKYSKTEQGTKFIPIHDPYNTHPDYKIDPRQRIWFDIPVLENPSCQNMYVLPERFAQHIQKGIDFMKQNNNTDNYDGFYDFEIEKAERNLNLFLNTPKSITDQNNFWDFFQQYDKRHEKNIIEVFPELDEFKKHSNDVIGIF